MNKKMRELLAKIQSKTAEAKALMEGENKDVEKANTIMDEIDALQKEFDTEKRIFEAEKSNGGLFATPAEPVAEPVADPKAAKENQISKFAKAFRMIVKGQPITDKSLIEGVDADGGYTVPEDIQTKINQFKDVDYDLGQDIAVDNVTTNKGARTYQVKSNPNEFADIDENGEITEEITAPTFTRVKYTIQDRAGFMPVSNDLLADSDNNIAEFVAQWLAKSDIATTNKHVLAKVALKEQTNLKDIDGIKKAVNVTLGQAYKAGAKIYTNDDGLNYLDTLKDANGRPLLNPDPTNSANLQLRCGTVVLPIKVLPNKVMVTTELKAPFIIGNLADYVKKFNRNRMSIMASNVATIGSFNAFANNMTLMRAIVRDDYEVVDADSIVNGYITLGE